MDKIIKALNGCIGIHESYIDIQNKTRSEKLSYDEIIKVEYEKGKAKKCGNLDIYTKSKGNMRLQFEEQDNEEFREVKKTILRERINKIAVIQTVECSNTLNTKTNNKNNTQSIIPSLICIVIGVAFIYIEYEVIHNSVNTSINALTKGNFHNPTFDNLLSTTLYILGILFIGTGIGLIGLRFKNGQKSTDLQQDNITSMKAENISVAEELKKYKNLLNEEVITEEEFEAKKKELLGL